MVRAVALPLFTVGVQLLRGKISAGSVFRLWRPPLVSEGAGELLTDELTEYGNRSVYASMMVTLKQLENKADNVSNVQNNVQWEFAVTIINGVAYMNSDEIFKDDLLKLVDNHKNICKLDEALTILTEYSLLNKAFDWGEDIMYSVHRIIQSSIRHNQKEMGTADTYYILVLKYAFAEDYFSRDVAQYADERASAVAEYYKNNPSPTILEYLIKSKATTAIEAVLKLSKIEMKEHDLLYHAVENKDLNMAKLLWKYGADINQLCRQMGSDPPLHSAVRGGNMEIVKWLLENGAAPTQRDWKGDNALHVATAWANHKMVSIIIKTDRAVVNETDDYGHTPLHVIDYSGNKEDILPIINVLVESGADITAVDNQGNTVLHSAACGTHAAAVSLILQRNKDIINIVNKFGKTALHYIPYYDTRFDDERILSTIRVLVDSGGDLTKVDIRGNTVFHTATRGAHAAAVSLILQLNKDLINIVNEDGQTALHVISYGDTNINDERILSTVRVLVDSGVDLTKVDIDGNTVLHSAAMGACAAAVPLILQLNKDLINIINKDRKTALHVIPYNNSFMFDKRIMSTMHALVDSGGDLTKVDIDGNTVLYLAARGARTKAVSLILQLNKDLINIINKDRKTALHVIPYNDRYMDDKPILSTMRVLVASGADLTKIDIDGNTVLYSAARGARTKAVSLILQRNKDLISILNKDRKTALHVLGNDIDFKYKYLQEEDKKELFACMKETARVLITNGLSLDTRDNNGCTPLDTVEPEFKDILLEVAEECNNQLPRLPVIHQGTE